MHGHPPLVSRAHKTLVTSTAGNGLRYFVRGSLTWRALPNDLPPWHVVNQQTRQWIKAGVFETIIHDLRRILRLLDDRRSQPTAAIFDSRTLQSTPESGIRAGYNGAMRRKGSKTHMAVDTLGHLLALHVTPADTQDRDQVERLARDVQEATGQNVQLAWVDQGYTGERPADAAGHGIRLEVVKLPEAKRGFVLLPRRWVSLIKISLNRPTSGWEYEQRPAPANATFYANLFGFQVHSDSRGWGLFIPFWAILSGMLFYPSLAYREGRRKRRIEQWRKAGGVPFVWL